jgi:hypothetical protein
VIRTWWAAAALLAIFAMHGLAAHAGTHDPMPQTSTSVGDAGHAGHAGRALATDGPGAVEHGEPGHEMAVLGMCLAVLATSALMALLRLGRPRSGLLRLLPRAATASSYATRVRTSLAPPDLHALSVLRC